MRVVVQRVKNAEVVVPETGYKASVGHGLLLLAAFIDEDTEVPSKKKATPGTYFATNRTSNKV